MSYDNFGGHNDSYDHRSDLLSILNPNTPPSTLQNSRRLADVYEDVSTDPSSVKTRRPFGNLARFLPADISFLTRYHIPYSVLVETMDAARTDGVEAYQHLIASGRIEREVYYQCLADYLGLDYIGPEHLSLWTIVPQSGIMKAIRHKPRVLLTGLDKKQVLAIAPEREEIERLRYHLGVSQQVKERTVIASPQTISRAYLNHLKGSLEEKTTNVLRRHMPDYSAFQVEVGRMVAGVLCLAFVLVLFVVLPSSMIGLIFASLLGVVFFCSSLLRFVAALTLRKNKGSIPALPPMQAKDLPIYTVLVAVYDEADIVGDLIAALAQIDWPSTKLDIKIVLESDDIKTIVAARAAIKAWPFMEIVEVPPGKPRTKPRALNYALSLAQGTYVAVFDAEDRPHPLQLKAAYHRFLTGDAALTCVQAPLLIDNASSSWLSSLFAVEYAGLFDGLLPALAHWRLPVLLGGTSNHFKADRLRAIGGWDPHNVTEDADLGIRLKRFGYCVSSIDFPTYEEAPTTFHVWLRQRTRWLKGWMQTALVHMRHPLHAISQLGYKGFFIFHLLATTLIFSALGYPFFVAVLAMQIAVAYSEGSIPLVTLLLAANLLFAFLAYGLLSARALSYRKKHHMIGYTFVMPFYWGLLFFAAWRAFVQLAFAPHVWEKTPHGDVRRLPLAKADDKTKRGFLTAKRRNRCA